MRRIDVKLVDALIYARSDVNHESVTLIADKFGLDRHGLARNMKKNLLVHVEFRNGEWWVLSEKEKNALSYYTSNSNTSYKTMRDNFHLAPQTLDRILTVFGIDKPVAQYAHTFNRNIFENIETEEDAYWLGFILADGYLNEDRGFLNIKLGAKDVAHLYKFCDYIGSDYSVIREDIGGVGNRIYSLTIHSRTVTNNLKQYGLHQRKSCIEVPYLKIKNHLKRHYVRGIIDGDGWIRKQLNGFGCVGSLSVLTFVRDYIHEVVALHRSYIKPHVKILKFEIRDSKIIREVVTHLYKNSQVYLDRKMDLAQQIF